jgi:two-component system chemotaxis response regulator CheB
VLRRIIEGQPDNEVVGEATSGSEAVDLAVTLRPDAVIMEVDLPDQDGVAVAERISESIEVPIVVATSILDRERLVATFRTVRRGVVGVFAKPTVPDQWQSFGDHLNDILVQVTRQRDWSSPERAHPPSVGRVPIRFVAVGASTGGPSALLEMLQEIESPYPASVLIVQHIAEGFDVPLANWLARETALDVRVAEQAELIARGQVRLAPAGSHLTLEPAGRLKIDPFTPPLMGHRPSADLLFDSLADARAPRTAAVLLSGMGSDGVEGMLRLRRAGAATAVQDEPSCAVWGMPRVAVERGAAELVMSPAAIGRWINDGTRGSYK